MLGAQRGAHTMKIKTAIKGGKQVHPDTGISG
jgi:hypothetical protein